MSAPGMSPSPRKSRPPARMIEAVRSRMRERKGEPMDLAGRLAAQRDEVNKALERYLAQAEGCPPRLREAVRYSVFAGGKRLRPILALEAAEAVGESGEEVMAFGCALELIHTYSLIHDDLPSMDDDDLRRGKPTNHVVFGEGMAILAGDALLTSAFALMARTARGMKRPEVGLAAMAEVAQAAGAAGMVGGQVADLEAEGRAVEAEELEYIHRHKTADMITAALVAGAYLAGGTEAQVEALRGYGESVGLAFQVVDDILDVEGNPDTLGKPVGSDRDNEKATYPALFGMAEAKRKAARLVDAAKAALAPLAERGEVLRRLADYMLKRTQ